MAPMRKPAADTVFDLQWGGSLRDIMSELPVGYILGDPFDDNAVSHTGIMLLTWFALPRNGVLCVEQQAVHID